MDTINCSLYFFIVDCNSIEGQGKDGMRLWQFPHHKRCTLEDLKTAYVKKHKNLKMIRKNQDDNSVQNAPRGEAEQVVEGKHVVEWRMGSAAVLLQLFLSADEEMELSCRSFNFWPPNPAKFKHWI